MQMTAACDAQRRAASGAGSHPHKHRRIAARGANAQPTLAFCLAKLSFDTHQTPSN
jgi:hypothetical protein